jgi:predicted RNA-binding protein with RPS1 domain
MPSYVPRKEPVKKQEELRNREIDLIIGIRKNVEADKLLKLVDKYRKAQLSMLKAKVHTFKENEFQKKPNNVTFEKLEKLTTEWTDKTNDDIIKKVKKINNL